MRGGTGHGSTTGALQADGLFACFCKPQIVLKLFHRSSAHQVCLESSTIPATACFTAAAAFYSRTPASRYLPGCSQDSSTPRSLDQFQLLFSFLFLSACISFLSLLSVSYIGSPSFSCSCSRLRPSFATSGPCFSSCRLRFDRSSPLSVGLGGFSFVIHLPSLSLSFFVLRLTERGNLVYPRIQFSILLTP